MVASRLTLLGTCSLCFIALLAAAGSAPAQQSGASPLSPPANGPRRVDPTWIAIVDATVHVSPTKTLERATVVVRGGRIQSVTEAQPGPDGKHGTGDDVATRLPIGPRVLDGKGLHAYAGFVDPFVEVDAPRPDAKRAGVHWNDGVTPQRSALHGAGRCGEGTARNGNHRRVHFAQGRRVSRHERAGEHSGGGQ
jgi:hypothetical protein